MNARRRLFCQEYTKDFNASRAARVAGYSERTAYAAGNSLLKILEVREEIKRLVDLKTMGTEEILITLSAIGRGDIGNVLDNSSGLDMDAARSQGLTPLIRKCKRVTNRFVSKDGAERETVVQEVELYSKLEAIHELVAIKGMVKSRSVLENPDGSALDLTRKNVTIYIPDNGRPRNQASK